MLRQTPIELGHALYNRLLTSLDGDRNLDKYLFVTGTPGMGKIVLAFSDEEVDCLSGDIVPQTPFSKTQHV